jgi:hypothetical protein
MKSWRGVRTLREEDCGGEILRGPVWDGAYWGGLLNRYLDECGENWWVLQLATNRVFRSTQKSRPRTLHIHWELHQD